MPRLGISRVGGDQRGVDFGRPRGDSGLIYSIIRGILVYVRNNNCNVEWGWVMTRIVLKTGTFDREKLLTLEGVEDTEDGWQEVLGAIARHIGENCRCESSGDGFLRAAFDVKTGAGTLAVGFVHVEVLLVSMDGAVDVVGIPCDQDADASEAVSRIVGQLAEGFFIQF